MIEYFTKAFSFFESFFEPQIFDPVPQDYTKDKKTVELLTALFQSSEYIKMLREIETKKNITIVFTPFEENTASFKETDKNNLHLLEILYDRSLNNKDAQKAISDITKEIFLKLPTSFSS